MWLIGEMHLDFTAYYGGDVFIGFTIISYLFCQMLYKRFRHFGKDKVTMDFAFFATAFNRRIPARS